MSIRWILCLILLLTHFLVGDNIQKLLGIELMDLRILKLMDNELSINLNIRGQGPGVFFYKLLLHVMAYETCSKVLKL